MAVVYVIKTVAGIVTFKRHVIIKNIIVLKEETFERIKNVVNDIDAVNMIVVLILRIQKIHYENVMY